MSDQVEHHDEGETPARGRAPLLRLAIGFGIAAAVLLSLFQLAEWRADNDLLQRYCDAPERHIALVGEVLRERAPAGDGSKRPYAVAAKLIFIVPQQTDEPDDAYLERLRRAVYEACG